MSNIVDVDLDDFKTAKEIGEIYNLEEYGLDTHKIGYLASSGAIASKRYKSTNQTILKQDFERFLEFLKNRPIYRVNSIL